MFISPRRPFTSISNREPDTDPSLAMGPRTGGFWYFARIAPIRNRSSSGCYYYSCSCNGCGPLPARHGDLRNNGKSTAARPEPSAQARSAKQPRIPNAQCVPSSISSLLSLLEPCSGCVAPYGYHNLMQLSSDANRFTVSVPILSSVCTEATNRN